MSSSNNKPQSIEKYESSTVTSSLTPSVSNDNAETDEKFEPYGNDDFKNNITINKIEKSKDSTNTNNTTQTMETENDVHTEESVNRNDDNNTVWAYGNSDNNHTKENSFKGSVGGISTNTYAESVRRYKTEMSPITPMVIPNHSGVDDIIFSHNNNLTEEEKEKDAVMKLTTHESNTSVTMDDKQHGSNDITSEALSDNKNKKNKSSKKRSGNRSKTATTSIVNAMTPNVILKKKSIKISVPPEKKNSIDDNADVTKNADLDSKGGEHDTNDRSAELLHNADKNETAKNNDSLNTMVDTDNPISSDNIMNDTDTNNNEVNLNIPVVGDTKNKMSLINSPDKSGAQDQRIIQNRENNDEKEDSETLVSKDIETDSKSPAIISQSPNPSQIDSTSTQEEENNQYNISQHAYDSLKALWGYGSSIKITKPILKATENVADKILHYTTGMHMNNENEEEIIKPTLLELDEKIVNPAIVRLLRALSPIQDKVDDKLRPVICLIVRKLYFITYYTPSKGNVDDTAKGVIFV